MDTGWTSFQDIQSGLLVRRCARRVCAWNGCLLFWRFRALSSVVCVCVVCVCGVCVCACVCMHVCEVRHCSLPWTTQIVWLNSICVPVDDIVGYEVYS